MKNIDNAIKERGLSGKAMTLGECIEVAEASGSRLSDVVVFEAMVSSELSFAEVLDEVLASFDHNFQALAAGLAGEKSFLFGSVSSDLQNESTPPIIEDGLINRMVTYTLAAQVGNHSVGLQPCAGTGDSCPYAGFMRAVLEDFDRTTAARAAAVILKIGTIFRAGKSTTGCNMEGFGAGSAATAAAFVELLGGRPEQAGHAVVLALSPTIGTPCTPRVMVPGLCATHIGGAILNGKLASHLAMHTNIPVNVPVDVMIAMATAIHPLSAKHLVPEVIRYMEPYFRTNSAVEKYIEQDIIDRETTRKEAVYHQAVKEVQYLARRANPIIKPFGTAVVGGSSQAVGSPTNAGRLAHFLAKGKISEVTIDLYPELFARRGINIPGILMGAVYGASTADGKMYREVMDLVAAEGIIVTINQVDEPQLQRVTVKASERNSMVDARNRGGGRLALVAVEPDLDECLQIASDLQIEIVL